MSDVSTDVPAKAPSLTEQAKIKRVEGQRIRLSENARVVWTVDVPEDHTPEDCLHPGYLWHRHEQIRRGQKIELVHEMQQFFIELLVARVDKDTQSIQTRIIHACDWRTEKLPAIDLSAARVEKMAADGWRVVNGAAVLSRGHSTRAEAEQWLRDRKLQVGSD